MEISPSITSGFKTKTKVVFNLNRLIVDTKYVNKHLKIGSDVWRIDIEVVEVMEENGTKQQWYEICLYLVSGSRAEVSAKFSAFIIDSQNEHIAIDDGSIEFKQIMNFKNGDGLILSLEKTDDFPDNKLKAVLFIDVDSQDVDISQISVCFDYSKFSDDEEFSDYFKGDFEIRCGTKQFFVPKLILISRPKTFQTMFLKNKTKDNIVIVDIDPEVMEQFLEFLKFGDTNQLDRMKEQLLRFAVKYKVFDLKNICENLIYTEIDSNNALNLWQLFNDLNCIEMKEKCIEFIAKIAQAEIRKNWNDFIKSNDNLFPELRKRLPAETRNSTEGKDDIRIKPRVHSFSYHYIRHNVISYYSDP